MRNALTFAFAAFAAFGASRKFEPAEIEKVLAYWNEPGRYSVDVPADFLAKGMWQCRLSVEGSKWLWNYNRVRGLGKAGQSVGKSQLPANRTAIIEKWVQDRIAHDFYQAKLAADAYNAYVAEVMGARRDGGSRTSRAAGRDSRSGDSGPNFQWTDFGQETPPEIVKLIGEPPRFAEAVRPLAYTIAFADGTQISYTDNVKLGDRNVAYRWSNGVMSGGRRLRDWPESELSDQFKEAGVSDSEMRVMMAVSGLEGGFDSVNTYDTGFVSIGFIQFASLQEGRGSLGRMMLRYKTSNPNGFDRDFRAFGIDVDAEGFLCVVDLGSGEERLGSAANALIIEDKRLTAVFQRAGRVSSEFRVAQIRSAYEDYFPAQIPIQVTLNGKVTKTTIGQIVRSEAGLATLMDRKVHMGNVEPLSQILQNFAVKQGVGKIEDLSKYERDIIAALRHRRDFLADPGLAQPKR